MTRQPPQNIAAEEALLGGCLLAREAIAAAQAVQLGPGDFYKPAHGHIWNAVVALAARGEPADVVTVADELRRGGGLDAAGGPGALISLQASAPAVSNAGRYARIIQELALLREGIAAAGETIDALYQLPEDVPGALTAAEARLRAVRLRQAGSTRLSRPVADALEPFLDTLEARADNPGAVWGVPTGWRDLDTIVGGLPPGEMTIVAARPGAGKTSWLLAYAWHVAHTLGRPALFASLEMTEAQLVEKLVAQVAHVPHERFKDNTLTVEDWQRVMRALDQIAAAPLHITDSPRLTVADISAESDKIAAGTGVAVATTCVDYLQKVKPPPALRGETSRYAVVASISNDIAEHAKLTGQAWAVGAQVGRGVDLRADKRPVMGDLRESGDIEQDAAVILTLYRDELYHRDSDDLGVIEMACIKNRYGRTGTARAAFLGHHGGRIADMAYTGPPALPRPLPGAADRAAGYDADGYDPDNPDNQDGTIS